MFPNDVFGLPVHFNDLMGFIQCYQKIPIGHRGDVISLIGFFFDWKCQLSLLPPISCVYFYDDRWFFIFFLLANTNNTAGTGVLCVDDPMKLFGKLEGKPWLPCRRVNFDPVENGN
jgi:hypothetical protein